MDDLRFRTRQGDHLAGQFGDGEFVRVADVHRTGEVVGRVVHHAHHAFDQVVDVLERTALPAVAVDRDIVAPQRLDDEIRDHAAVVDVHFRTVGVEYADNLHGNAVFAVAHKERLGAAFALVVARADAQRVDVAPVILALGVDQRVAVDLRGRGLEDFRPVVRIDAPMPIGYITETLLSEIEQMEPFGVGNPKPIFAEQHFRILSGRKFGVEGTVLKLQVQNDVGNRIGAVCFRRTEEFEQFVIAEWGEAELKRMYEGRENLLDIAFTYYPSVNEYNGRRELQIQIAGWCRIPR